jgi:hypothetical protein
MVCPEEDDVVSRAVQRLDPIPRDPGEVDGGKLPQVCPARLNICLGVVGCRGVVGVAEDLDVWVQSLEGMFGVLMQLSGQLGANTWGTI